ncbi:hypothetical protein ASE74_08010 [Pedobacter sp. Leaf216]|uniref:hypothetical protein n=1 Tax=Pedobacter sp. Leaf216 TaxID=1735684 RepID=UPI0006F3DFB5|nr:hypothetical protein [Pedobacter sp. Leaf216]KQM66345.1 hypothetical protein ASE74_08010 [Pedobacter sp. Leaf216]
MKFKHLIGIAIALFFFAACKKNNPVIEPPVIQKEDPLEYAHDSVSYSIDGKTYSTAKYSSISGAGNYQPNSKVDSIVKNAYYISGNKDSVLYSKRFAIYNDDRIVNVTFIKTYSKNVMRQILILVPNDVYDLFKVGSRNYALDFGRDNKQNGIAISISDKDTYKTFGSDSFRNPPTLSPDAQKESKFEVISFRKLKSGTYVLEAKFNAMLYNEMNASKKLENGYLRLVIHNYDLIL